eukprot:s303_g21.t1
MYDNIPWDHIAGSFQNCVRRLQGVPQLQPVTPTLEWQCVESCDGSLVVATSDQMLGVYMVVPCRLCLGWRRHVSSNRSPRWKRYGLTAGGSGCKTATVTDDGYRIESDTPKSAGGSGTAPQPVQLLLGALVGCEQATATFVAAKMRLPPIRRIEFHVQAERDEWGSLAPPIHAAPPELSRLQRIWGTAHVYSDATADQIAAIAEAVKRRCPVASMVIESGCELDVRWVKGRCFWGLGLHAEELWTVELRVAQSSKCRKDVSRAGRRERGFGRAQVPPQGAWFQSSSNRGCLPHGLLLGRPAVALTASGLAWSRANLSRGKSWRLPRVLRRGGRVFRDISKEIAARVEAAVQDDSQDRFVRLADREEDTDMSIDTLEAIYIGQARSSWKTVPLGKSAFDWQMYASLIEELQPRTIIDIGSWAGGSALFFADFAELLAAERFQKVVSLDITLKSVSTLQASCSAVKSTSKCLPSEEIEPDSIRRFNSMNAAPIDSRPKGELFTDDFAAALPHPWLVSEDAHYHFDAVMERLHILLQPGDYLVVPSLEVEDTSTQMHDWFEENNESTEEKSDAKKVQTAEAIRQLRDKKKILRRYCSKHPEMYRCDTKHLGSMSTWVAGKAVERFALSQMFLAVMAQEDLVDYSDEEVPAKLRAFDGSEQWHSACRSSSAPQQALEALQQLHGRSAR